MAGYETMSDGHQRNMVLPRRDDQPKPGLYKIRLCRGGPWVAAELRYGPPSDPETGKPLDRSPRWQTFINGREFGNGPTPESAGVYKVWPYGVEIDEAEFRYLLGVSNWAKSHSPQSPEADPDKPVDFLKAPITF